MPTHRTYGQPPFKTAVLHGGPGASGGMAPVARALSARRGILEPIQNALSVNGQVGELKSILETHGTPPVVLIGHSWGAWLGFILAAMHPALVKKLILVSGAPFTSEYAAEISKTRNERLSVKERKEFKSAMDGLVNPRLRDKAACLARLEALISKTDSADPVPEETEPPDILPFRADIFLNVWKEAAEMRASGRILELGRAIACPVTAVHGSYDPHPPEGVRLPLSRTVKNFRFILLDGCGHKPWAERGAGAGFFGILQKEIE
jgi:pimeloyl-ACP methyl ester carboxylesterase